MSDAFELRGYEESVLYSDDDYEPYGYSGSPRLAPVKETAIGPRFGPYEREVEAAVLRRLDACPGC